MKNSNPYLDLYSEFLDRSLKENSRVLKVRALQSREDRQALDELNQSTQQLIENSDSPNCSDGSIRLSLTKNKRGRKVAIPIDVQAQVGFGGSENFYEALYDRFVDSAALPVSASDEDLDPVDDLSQNNNDSTQRGGGIAWNVSDISISKKKREKIKKLERRHALSAKKRREKRVSEKAQQTRKSTKTRKSHRSKKKNRHKSRNGTNIEDSETRKIDPTIARWQESLRTSNAGGLVDNDGHLLYNSMPEEFSTAHSVSKRIDDSKLHEKEFRFTDSEQIDDSTVHEKGNRSADSEQINDSTLYGEELHQLDERTLPPPIHSPLGRAAAAEWKSEEYWKWHGPTLHFGGDKTSFQSKRPIYMPGVEESSVDLNSSAAEAVWWSGGTGQKKTLPGALDREEARKISKEMRKAELLKREEARTKKKMQDEENKKVLEKMKMQVEVKKKMLEKKKVQDEAKKIELEKKKVKDEAKKIELEKKKMKDEARKIKLEKKKMKDEAKKIELEKKKMKNESIVKPYPVKGRMNDAKKGKRDKKNSNRNVVKGRKVKQFLEEDESHVASAVEPKVEKDVLRATEVLQKPKDVDTSEFSQNNDHSFNSTVTEVHSVVDDSNDSTVDVSNGDIKDTSNDNIVEESNNTTLDKSNDTFLDENPNQLPPSHTPKKKKGVLIDTTEFPLLQAAAKRTPSRRARAFLIKARRRREALRQKRLQAQEQKLLETGAESPLRFLKKKEWDTDDEEERRRKTLAEESKKETLLVKALHAAQRKQLAYMRMETIRAHTSGERSCFLGIERDGIPRTWEALQKKSGQGERTTNRRNYGLPYDDTATSGPAWSMGRAQRKFHISADGKTLSSNSIDTPKKEWKRRKEKVPTFAASRKKSKCKEKRNVSRKLKKKVPLGGSPTRTSLLRDPIEKEKRRKKFDSNSRPPWNSGYVHQETSIKHPPPHNPIPPRSSPWATRQKVRKISRKKKKKRSRTGIPEAQKKAQERRRNDGKVTPTYKKTSAMERLEALRQNLLEKEGSEQKTKKNESDEPMWIREEELPMSPARPPSNILRRTNDNHFVRGKASGIDSSLDFGAISTPSALFGSPQDRGNPKQSLQEENIEEMLRKQRKEQLHADAGEKVKSKQSVTIVDTDEAGNPLEKSFESYTVENLTERGYERNLCPNTNRAYWYNSKTDDSLWEDDIEINTDSILSELPKESSKAWESPPLSSRKVVERHDEIALSASDMIRQNLWNRVKARAEHASNASGAVVLEDVPKDDADFDLISALLASGLKNNSRRYVATRILRIVSPWSVKEGNRSEAVGLKQLIDASNPAGCSLLFYGADSEQLTSIARAGFKSQSPSTLQLSSDISIADRIHKGLPSTHAVSLPREGSPLRATWRVLVAAVALGRKTNFVDIDADDEFEAWQNAEKIGQSTTEASRLLACCTNIDTLEVVSNGDVGENDEIIYICHPRFDRALPCFLVEYEYTYTPEKE
eukprot:g4709.t1